MVLALFSACQRTDTNAYAEKRRHTHFGSEFLLLQFLIVGEQIIAFVPNLFDTLIQHILLH